MRLRLLVLLCLNVGLLVFQPYYPVLGLPTEGSSYYYHVNNRRTTQENLGEIHVSDQMTNCRITIFQVILIGNRYHVRFSGYEARYPYNYVLTNSSVDLSSNLISFDLTTRDYDDDNRSSYTRMVNSPEVNPIDDCEIFLVNPDWVVHNNTWNYSVDQIAYQQCVNHALSLTYYSGSGVFQYSITVNVEDSVWIAGDYLDVNGTTVYDFYCSYDADGVLLHYSAGYSSHLYDDFNQITVTSKVSITRGAVLPLNFLSYPFVVYQILLAVITLLVGIGIGFWIGQRQRRIHS